MNIVKKHMKRCLASLVIGKMQTKTTMKFPFIPTRVAIIKDTYNTKCWQGSRHTGTLYTAVGNVYKMVQCSGKKSFNI